MVVAASTRKKRILRRKRRKTWYKTTFVMSSDKGLYFGYNLAPSRYISRPLQKKYYLLLFKVPFFRWSLYLCASLKLNLIKKIKAGRSLENPLFSKVGWEPVQSQVSNHEDFAFHTSPINFRTPISPFQIRAQSSNELSRLRVRSNALCRACLIPSTSLSGRSLIRLATIRSSQNERVGEAARWRGKPKNERRTPPSHSARERT